MSSTSTSLSGSQGHLQSVKPVFIKGRDIGDSSVTPLTICNAITRVISSPSKLDGVQRINSIWRIYLKDMTSRLELTVKQEIRVNGKLVPVYDRNPYVTFSGLPMEKKMNSDKLTIKNLPLSVSNVNDGIEKMLAEKNIILRSPIRYGFIRNEDGGLTTYKSGDRYVFVEPFETPLPKQQTIGIFHCLVLHHGKNGPPCKSCGVEGHRPGDNTCKAKPKEQILAFKGYEHPLSNHYPCKLSVYGLEFKSVEHAFFYRMATDFDMGQLADDIRKAKHAGIVKRLSKNIAGDDKRWKWEEENKDVMVHLLNAKLEQCPEFRQCLIDSAGLVIAEATPSRIWGTGLSPYVTKHTSAEYWLGRNLLGAILTEMSQQLVGGGGISSSYVEPGANELSVQDTSLENQEHLLHSGQQLISESNQPGVMSVELSDSASQPDSQVPHQGDSSSVNPTDCPPTSQPVELSTNQTTKSTNQPKCQNNSLNSTHKGNQQQLQSQLAKKPNVLA